MSLLQLDDVESFHLARDVCSDDMNQAVITSVRDLDEREEIEPFIRTILTEVGETPHGPAELVDILSHKIVAAGVTGVGAFIIKGRSFKTVRPKDVAHQIYRLEKITPLHLAVLAYSGTILDQAKEQFLSTAERVAVNSLVLDAHDLARLFVAYGYLCPRDGNRISVGRCQCGYSPKHRIQNPLQREALRGLADIHRWDKAAGLVVLPPGGGKTRIAAEDAKAVGATTVLYVAHTHEILDVAQSEFEAVFGAAEVTRTEDLTAPSARRVRLATIQFLAQHLDTLRKDAFDYVVVDEFHHAASPTYRRLLDRLQPQFLLGLTATPFRGDRQDVLELCAGNIACNFEMRAGIEMGVLTPYHYYGCFDDVDYTTIRHRGTRYDVRDLERALVIPERREAVVRQWRDLAAGKPSIAFCVSHRHAKDTAMTFRSAGIPAEPYLSETNANLRKELQRRFSSGDLKLLCVVDVLNEGADFPYIECLLFLRPTESVRIFHQQLGRGLRKYVGKSHCLVIDFIGNFKNAYKVVEYQSLLPEPEEVTHGLRGWPQTRKELLNLPLGCEVHFDARVLDVFVRQTLDPRHATRHNIARILVYQFERTCAKLGRKATKADIDRASLLDSRFYILVFGTWAKFEKFIGDDWEAALMPMGGANSGE